MIRLGVDVQGLAETIRTIAQAPVRLRQAGEEAMRESLDLFSKTLRDDFLKGPFPENIESRSGSFSATFAKGNRDNIYRVESQGSKIVGTTGSKDRRAPILNYGGVIRPTRSQFLAVRTDFTKDGSGVVRAKYRGPLRGIPNTFVRPIRATRAKAAVFEKIGSLIIPIAWLVRYVLIKGRHYMEKATTAATPRIHESWRVKITKAMDQLFRR